MYNNWPVVVANICKSWKKWARISWILGREAADARMSGVFCKAVVQAVILFVSETWVMTPHIGWMLVGFKHSGSYRLTGKQP